VDHESRYEVYTKGTFEANFDWTEPGWQDKMPHILTIHAEQLHTTEHSFSLTLFTSSAYKQVKGYKQIPETEKKNKR
jgi:hypothetical protein